MVYAAVKHCPAIGGTLPDDAGQAGRRPRVVPLGNAVAVVAGNTWQAMQLATRSTRAMDDPRARARRTTARRS